MIPPHVKHYLDDKGVSYEESSDLLEVSKVAHVLYQTRIQKERFPSVEEYDKASGQYIINQQVLDIMPKDAVILHPLPRLDEIDVEVDADPRAAYFRQAQNGLYIRMALIEKCLSS